MNIVVTVHTVRITSNWHTDRTFVLWMRLLVPAPRLKPLAISLLIAKFGAAIPCHVILSRNPRVSAETEPKALPERRTSLLTRLTRDKVIIANVGLRPNCL